MMNTRNSPSSPFSLPRSRINVSPPDWLLERIVKKIAESFTHGHLQLTLPGDKIRHFGHCTNSNDSAAVEIFDYGVLVEAAKRGPIALAETYYQGRWHTDNLTNLLSILAQNQDAFRFRAARMLSIRPISDRWVHFRRSNSKRQARRNIHAHYDLGNAFYTAWLDGSMTYSAARFRTERAAQETDLHDPELTADDNASPKTLYDAQINKFDDLIQATDIRDGHRVLEIGCGWGGFAIYAATTVGCHVTAITISEEQFRYTTQRVAEHNLEKMIDVVLCDYRDIASRFPNHFDRIVSIEMFEAVGEKYWPTYARAVLTALTDAGKAGLQIITVDDLRFQEYRQRPDFIQRYVFPGGMLPSPERLCGVFKEAGATGVQQIQRFGPDYATTLKIWQTQFNARWAELRALGFDEPFQRFWNYYLSYCQVGFRLGWTDVGHFVVTR